MVQFGRGGGGRLRRGDLLDVRVGGRELGALLAEGLVEGAPQLQRDREREGGYGN